MKDLIQQSSSQTQIDEYREKLDLFQKTVEEITTKLTNITIKVQDKEAMQNIITEIVNKGQTLISSSDIEIITNSIQELITSNKITKARLGVVEEDIDQIIEQQLRIEESIRTEKLKLFQEAIAELTTKIENNTAVNVKDKTVMQNIITEIVNKVQTLINSSDIEIITTSIQEFITSNKITKARFGVIEEDVDQLIEQQSKVNHNIIKVKLLEKIALVEAEKYYLKGRDYFLEQDKQHEALEYFNKAINLNPNYAKAYVEKGEVLCISRKYIESLECIEQAIKLNENDVRAHYNKAIVLVKLNKIQNAKECFNLAEKLTCNDADGYYARAYALTELERYQEALKDRNKAIELKPDCAYAYETKGETLFELGSYQEAIKAFDQAIELNAKLFFARYNKAIALMCLEKYQEAVEVFDQAIKHTVDQAIKLNVEVYSELYHTKSEALTHLGKHQEAREAIDQAIKIEQASEFKQNVNMFIVDKITYDNPLLNHPKLLQAAVESKLNSNLIQEAINNNDEELILAGLISVGYDVGAIN